MAASVKHAAAAPYSRHDEETGEGPRPLDRVRLALDSRFGGPCRLRAVPATGRGLDVHRLVRRRVGRPRLHRKLGGDERLLVEASRYVVALLGGILVALLRGEREPLVGFGEVLIDADPAGIEDSEIVLAVRDALVGGLAEPLGGGAIVGLAVDALGIEHREIV